MPSASVTLQPPRSNAKALLEAFREITFLKGKYAAAKDETVKAELDRLSAELAKLPERWEFYVRKGK